MDWSEKKLQYMISAHICNIKVNHFSKLVPFLQVLSRLTAWTKRGKKVYILAMDIDSKRKFEIKAKKIQKGIFF